MTRRRRLGGTGPELSSIGLGCMSMSYPRRDDAESVLTIAAAVHRGVNFFDTADKYGHGHNEHLVGRALRHRRSDVVLATKVGFVGSSRDVRPVDSTPQHIHAATRASLRRLGTEAVDLLYLHRVDPLVPVEESVGAMAELVAAGLVRQIGLSEVSTDTLRRAHAVHPVAALQSEYSLWSRDPEDGMLGLCAELGVTFVAYSPLGIGVLTGRVRHAGDLPPGNRLARGPRVAPGNLERNLRLVEALREVAEAKECTPAQLAIAWLLARGVVPIPGTAQVRHLLENLGALDVRLSGHDLRRLDDLLPPGAAAGGRKPAAGLALTDR